MWRVFSTLRAYKLGKNKRSYNQVQLTFDRSMLGVKGKGSGEEEDVLNIYEATERSFSLDVPKGMKDSALEYELKLYNGATVRALIYLVYADPLQQPGASGAASSAGVKGKTAMAGFGPNGSGAIADRKGFSWLPVTRARCSKDCEGPILCAIQRLGKQGRTQNDGARAAEAEAAAAEAPVDGRAPNNRVPHFD